MTMLGLKHSIETRKKISLAGIGRKISNKTRIKHSISAKKSGVGLWMIGRKHTEEWKNKMSIIMKKNGNHLPSNKGTHFSEEHKNKIREAHLKRWNIIGRKQYKRPKHDRGEYKNWRKAVYERDNYTCQECGLHSGNGKTVILNAHHIKSWSDYPELRFDINNGITLCRSCHKLTGNFGRKRTIRHRNSL